MQPRAVQASQRFDIGTAQAAAQQLPAQKRRIADQDIGFGPVRFAALRRQDCVPALNGLQRLQDRVLPHGEPIAAHPLNFADPHRHAGQFGGVGIDLYALDVGRADRWKAPLQAQLFGLQLHLMLQILQRQQRQIQEVARTAGGVQHPKTAQPFQKLVQQPLGLRLLPRSRPRGLGRSHSLQTAVDLPLRLAPFGQQGAAQDRLDDQHDLVPVRVVGAKLGALLRVQPALEQGAENGGVDLRPVQGRGGQGEVDFRLLQGQGGGVLKQAAVEPGHRLEANPPAAGHRAEQFLC